MGGNRERGSEENTLSLTIEESERRALRVLSACAPPLALNAPRGVASRGLQREREGWQLLRVGPRRAARPALSSLAPPPPPLPPPRPPPRSRSTSPSFLLSPLSLHTPHAHTAPPSIPKPLAFLAAAAVLLASPSADAKVVLAKSTSKKVFQGEPSAPRERAAPAAKAAKKAGGGFITPSIGPSAGVLALPGEWSRGHRGVAKGSPRGHRGVTEGRVRVRARSSLNPPLTPLHALFFLSLFSSNPGAILGIAGAAALASSVDSSFGTFIDKATLRDCNNYAGYEPALKGEGGPPARAAPGGGAKKVLKKKK